MIFILFWENNDFFIKFFFLKKKQILHIRISQILIIKFLASQMQV